MASILAGFMMRIFILKVPKRAFKRKLFYSAISQQLWLRLFVLKFSQSSKFKSFVESCMDVLKKTIPNKNVVKHNKHKISKIKSRDYSSSILFYKHRFFTS